MYVVIAIHHPRAEYVAEYLDFIAGLEQVTRGTVGLIEFGSWFDEQNCQLVEMSIWESKDDYDESFPLLAELHEDLQQAWSRCPGDVLRLGRPRRHRTRMTAHDLSGQDRLTRGSSTA
jgi:hypothetical protein